MWKPYFFVFTSFLPHIVAISYIFEETDIFATKRQKCQFHFIYKTDIIGIVVFWRFVIMKILLLNGSMRGNNSSSLKVAHAFVQGMVEENGPDNTEVTEINLREKRIEHCMGCFCCWKVNKGECVIHDDMDEIRRLVMESDVIIECFPLYFFGLPSKMKAFMDRMISFVSEYRAHNGDDDTGRFLHEMRYPELMEKKLVLVSACGYEETVDCYDSIKVQFNQICGPEGYTLITAPQGGMLAEKTLENKVKRYLTKFTDAGHEFVREGKVSPETIAKLEVPMLGHNTFEKVINLNWDDPNVGPYGKHGGNA